MQSKMGRLFQRYAVPAFAVSLYHLFKSRAILSPSARIQLSRRIQIGRGTVVKPYVVVQSTAGIIRLGRNCALSSFDHLSTGEGDIIIGDFVRIAPNCTLIGGTKDVSSRSKRIVDHPEVRPNGIVIGDDVLIGAGSVIMPGTQIGNGAVIGAGSVVRGTIPAFAVFAGSPAQQIGERK